MNPLSHPKYIAACVREEKAQIAYAQRELDEAAGALATAKADLDLAKARRDLRRARSAYAAHVEDPAARDWRERRTKEARLHLKVIEMEDLVERLTLARGERKHVPYDPTLLEGLQLAHREVSQVYNEILAVRLAEAK